MNSNEQETTIALTPQSNALDTAEAAAYAKACLLRWQNERITAADKAFIAENAAKHSIDSKTAELAIHASKAPIGDIITNLCAMGASAKTELERVLSSCSIRNLASVMQSPALSMMAQSVSIASTAKKILLRASASLGCVVPSDAETLELLVGDIADAIEAEYLALSPKEFEQAIKNFAKNSANAQNHRGEDKKAGEYKAFSVEYFHIIMRDYTQARNKFLLTVPHLLDREGKKVKAEKEAALLAQMSAEDIAYKKSLHFFREFTAKYFVKGAIVDGDGHEGGALDELCEVILRMVREGEIVVDNSEKMELFNYAEELLYGDYAALKEHLAVSAAAAEGTRTNRVAKVSGAFGVRLPSGFKSAVVSLWLATPYAVELLAKNKAAGKLDPLYSTLFSIYMLKLTYNYAAFRAILRRCCSKNLPSAYTKHGAVTRPNIELFRTERA